jgi:hypothetical protein
MKKIPKNTEASNVFVGEVDYLENELTVFVRLEKPVLLPKLTE